MKISIDDVLKKVKDTKFLQPEGTTLTICILKMQNGFDVTGQSGCADPAEFDPEKGEEIAHRNALKKAHELEGYLLAERLSQGES